MKKTATVALLLAACGDADPVVLEPPAQTHNIIAVVPLTGTSAGVAKGTAYTVPAMQLAIEDLERAGGLDKPIKLHLIDAADNTSAVIAERLGTQIEMLTTSDGTRHVAAIITRGDTSLRAAAPTALAAGIPFFEVESGVGLDGVELPVEADQRYAYTLRPLCQHEAAMTADLFKSRQADRAWQRVFVIRGAHADDELHTRELRIGMAKQGLASAILNPEDYVVRDGEPFDDAIAAAAAAGADVLYWHMGGYTANREFLRAAEGHGFAGKLVTCGNARSGALLDYIAPYASGGTPGAYTAGTSDEGRLFFAMRSPLSNAFATAALRPGYTQLANKWRAAVAYDATTLIGLGIAAAGTSEPTALQAAIEASAQGGQKFGYGELAAALEAAKAGLDIDLDGASGPLDSSYDAVQGNRTPGRYYFETVGWTGSGPYRGYDFLELASPVQVR